MGQAQSGRQSSGDDLRHRALTKRELEVMRLVAQGKKTKGIANTLGLSERTVRTHLERLFLRLRVHSRAQAVARYLEQLERDARGGGPN